LDEDRWWDLNQYVSGQLVTLLSKEFIRKHYRDNEYQNKLLYARKNKMKEPDIAALPQDMVKEASNLYENMYTKICTSN